ncbi:MAG: LLM class F420-dependent oxidoreductase [Acidimicrobiia bacterium]
MDLGRVGVWTSAFRMLEPDTRPAAVRELEGLGYGAIWFPGGAPDGAFAHARDLLEASERLVVATGIVSVWSATAEVVAAANRSLRADHPDRFLLGLGISHPEGVNRQAPGTYRRPLATMVEYLDALDRLDPDGRPGQRALAALGPKMLALSAARTAGAHPYFVPVEHTAFARAELGGGALLVPEQMVLVETDPERARAIARQHMAVYLGLVNYTSNLRRFGYGDDDFAGGGSDRLVDAIVAWGDAETVAERVRAHLDAGADQVCLQVLTEDRTELPMAAWRTLAEILDLA